MPDYGGSTVTKAGDMPMVGLLRRAGYILKTEGLKTLLRRGSEFLFGGNYYLYEHNLWEESAQTSQANIIPKIQNFTLEIVHSNQQADELATRGFEFRSADRRYRKWLDAGAVATCLFVGRELAHIGWIAMSQQAKNQVDVLPYKVDFANGEACVGWCWTNRKYRGMGLMPYAGTKRLQFLRERGFRISCSSITVDNIASQRATNKVIGEPYARVRYWHILWWKFWKEIPLTKDGRQPT